MTQKLKAYARSLRKNSTDAEDSLWYNLRSRRLSGLKFKRQHPIGNYIVDFICLDKKVIVELDGSQHLQQSHYDSERDDWLKNQGFKVLRYHNNEFFESKEEVLEVIALECLGSPSP